MENYKSMCRHIDRRANEVTYRRCQYFSDDPCLDCQKNLPKSKKLLSLVKKSGGLLFEPTKSPSHPDHFLSYLEMVEMAEQGNVTSFSKPNDTLVIGNLGSCALCPSWCFSSKTEKDRHMALLHPSNRKRTFQSNDAASQQTKFICKHENGGLSFKTYHRLKKHKDERNHYIRNRKDKKVSVKASNIRNCIEAYTRPLADAEKVNTETEDEEVEVESEESASVSRTVEDEDEEGVETFEEEMMPGTESEEEDEEEERFLRKYKKSKNNNYFFW